MIFIIKFTKKVIKKITKKHKKFVKNPAFLLNKSIFYKKTHFLTKKNNYKIIIIYVKFS